MKGQTQPVLEHTVTRDGVAVDLTDADVKFQMRPVGSSTLSVDADAVVVSPLTGGVEYRWQAADTAATGDFIGWWEVTLPSTDPVDTVEVLVQVRDHVPAHSGLCTLDEVKSADPTGQAVGHLDDARILQLIQAVTVAVLDYTGRDFVDRGGTNPRSRVIPLRWPPVGGVIHTPDLAAAPTLVEAVTDLSLTDTPTSLASSEWVAEPLDREAWEPVTSVLVLAGVSSGVRAVRVSGTWGWPAVPADVRDATVETVVHRLRARRALTSQSPDQSEFGVGPQMLWPTAAKQVLDRYRTPVIA